ncbi:hypothetical protein B0O99DRAFT_682326 [Bisporella sp. PMI_857]|nr:hypothetical protein B0O99DRAFT_682326 [Bisporella sp. PMI_857]
MSGEDSPQVASPMLSPSLTDAPELLGSLFSDRINSETRPIHSQLNRLILVRLPLALPPYTTNPSIYISGLLHIAPIYTNFEFLWEAIIDDSRRSSATKDDTSIACSSYSSETADPDCKNLHIFAAREAVGVINAPKISSRTQSLLAHLRLPSLLRAGRLRADIRVLTGTPEHRIQEQLAAVARQGKLAAFLEHTKKSVDENPHVLLAYAWVLYMALFSGGRYLRACLRDAGGLGTQFWTRDPSPVCPTSLIGENQHRKRSQSDIGSGPWNLEPDVLPTPCPERRRTFQANSDSVADSQVNAGLQFFHFKGEEDGEDIKREFKKRINEASALLTAQESEDIIREAQIIFEFMVDMVHELDQVMGTDDDDINSVRLRKGHPNFRRTKDSVAIRKSHLTRKYRNLAQSSDRLEYSGYLEALMDGTGSAWETACKVVWSVNHLVRGKRHVSFTPVTIEVDAEESSESTDTINDREIDVLVRTIPNILAPFGILLLLVVWYGFTWVCGRGI